MMMIIIIIILIIVMSGPRVGKTKPHNRAVIDIHFFSIRSLTFYFSIPIISIRF